MTTVSNERLAEMLAEVEIEFDNALSDAEADQNPQLAVDPVGEFDLIELRSILTEIQSLRAQGGVRVKSLEWHKSEIIGWNGDWHTVPTAYSIRCADENGWKWSGFGGFGYEHSDEAAKSAAQADYERRILSSLEDSPAPVSELVEASCPGCHGTGDQGGNPSYGVCDDCNGTGKVSQTLTAARSKGGSNG